MAKKALVTGGTKGIGYSTTLKLKELGYDVTVIGRDFSNFNIEGVKTITANNINVFDLNMI